MITHYRVKFHRQYLTECLDTLLLKNRSGAMIAQPRQRQAALRARQPPAGGSAAAVPARPRTAAFQTVPLRVDEFLDHPARPVRPVHRPASRGDGFGPAIVTDHAALRENRAAFIARLREIGFYPDLSDAYLTQTITPRYIIKASSEAGA